MAFFFVGMLLDPILDVAIEEINKAVPIDLGIDLDITPSWIPELEKFADIGGIADKLLKNDVVVDKITDNVNSYEQLVQEVNILDQNILDYDTALSSIDDIGVVMEQKIKDFYKDAPRYALSLFDDFLKKAVESPLYISLIAGFTAASVLLGPKYIMKLFRVLRARAKSFSKEVVKRLRSRVKKIKDNFYKNKKKIKDKRAKNKSKRDKKRKDKKDFERKYNEIDKRLRKLQYEKWDKIKNSLNTIYDYLKYGTAGSSLVIGGIFAYFIDLYSYLKDIIRNTADFSRDLMEEFLDLLDTIIDNLDLFYNLLIDGVTLINIMIFLTPFLGLVYIATIFIQNVERRY
jgi:hypothetical protein